VAALPGGQPGLPQPGDGQGQGAPQPARRGRLRSWLGRAALVALPALLALNLATSSEVVGIDAVDEFVRVLGACVFLFGLTGFPLTRLALPEGLRRHEWLWVLPVGAAATALAMTPLGFLGIPFTANLVIVLAAGAVGSVVMVRRSGWPEKEDLRSIAWPSYLALILAAVALVPFFRAGFATVIGEGSDAHLAAGTGEFLRHSSPLAVDEDLPVDQMPLVWRSKYPIYYAFGAVSSLSGMETFQTLSCLAAILLAFAALGFFVLARDMLGAGVGVAAVAMGIAGLDRMVLHTGMHPYFNQTWGYVTIPFALVLAWWIFKSFSWGAVGLLALFCVVGVLAYPLSGPIPLFALWVMWLADRRRRRKAGEPVVSVREAFRRGRRGLGRGWQRVRPSSRLVRWPLYAVGGVIGFFGGLTALFLAFGAFEKFSGAMQVLLNTNQSLELWGGDLSGWFPEQHFFALPAEPGWWVGIAAITALAVRELWRLERHVAIGFLAVIVVSALIALEMRLRDFGFYFHFKILAFVGPFVVVLAAVAMGRVRRWWIGPVLLFFWVSFAHQQAREELQHTFDQVPRTVQALHGWGDRLPDGASVRLDMNPGSQLWVAYMLAEHPLCSQRPLSTTSYPHVPLSRAADYVLVRGIARPFDAQGPALERNKEFRLYKLRAGLPGTDRCSQRMIQTVSRIQRFQ
jgi:hypothetical protein